MSVVDRLHDSLNRILQSELAQRRSALRAMMTWSYTVASVTMGTPILIDCRFSGGPPIPNSVDTSPIMPDLPKVVLRPGPGGTIAVPKPGSTVFIQFVNGQITTPYVVALDPNSTPTLVQLGGGTGPAVARVGDSVTITAANISAAVMVAGSNPVTLTNPLVCKITSGSTIVEST